MKGSEPPAALGTTVPSIGPVAGGPPQTTYPFSESEAVIPQKIVAVIGKLFCQFEAEAAMDVGGDDGILKIIGVAVALAAEIKPGLRVLMHEQRRERADVADAIIFENGPLPGVPGFGRSGCEADPMPSRYIIIISL